MFRILRRLCVTKMIIRMGVELKTIVKELAKIAESIECLLSLVPMGRPMVGRSYEAIAKFILLFSISLSLMPTDISIYYCKSIG